MDGAVEESTDPRILLETSSMKMVRTVKEGSYKKGFTTIYESEEYLGSALKLKLYAGDRQFSVGFNVNSRLDYVDFVETVKRFDYFAKEIYKEGSWGKAWKSSKKPQEEVLQSKTLLVDASLLKEEVDESTFAEIYPYPFKFVAPDVIEKAILKSEKDKLFFSIVEEKIGVLVQYICEAEMGEIHSLNYSILQTTGSIKHKAFNNVIGKSDLKKLRK